MLRNVVEEKRFLNVCAPLFDVLVNLHLCDEMSQVERDCDYEYQKWRVRHFENRRWCSVRHSLLYSELSVQCTLVIGLSELGVDLAIRYILATRHLELASAYRSSKGTGVLCTHYC